MKFLIVSVGRPRDATLARAIAEYEARAAHYWPFETREVREVSARGLPPAEVKRQEGERLRERAGAGTHLVACDERGTQLDSAAFSRWLVRERERAASDVAFLIGGAFGLAEEVRAAARTTLAFCTWTLPHELARLILAEQLYRAGTIARGEPYHK